MILEAGKRYVAAFQKPWWVSSFMMQGWARGLAIELEGFWPMGHPNAPRVTAPNDRPYTHLAAGYVGRTSTINVPPEVAWVQELVVPAPERAFVLRRRTA